MKIAIHVVPTTLRADWVTIFSVGIRLSMYYVRVPAGKEHPRVPTTFQISKTCT